MYSYIIARSEEWSLQLQLTIEFQISAFVFSPALSGVQEAMYNTEIMQHLCPHDILANENTMKEIHPK